MCSYVVSEEWRSGIVIAIRIRLKTRSGNGNLDWVEIGFGEEVGTDRRALGLPAAQAVCCYVPHPRHVHCQELRHWRARDRCKAARSESVRSVIRKFSCGDGKLSWFTAALVAMLSIMQTRCVIRAPLASQAAISGGTMPTSMLSSPAGIESRLRWSASRMSSGHSKPHQKKSGVSPWRATARKAPPPVPSSRAASVKRTAQPGSLGSGKRAGVASGTRTVLPSALVYHSRHCRYRAAVGPLSQRLTNGLRKPPARARLCDGRAA